MKILFAVNNEKIFETIIKQYQKDYKEIVSYKNVYYFNAIIKELQKDISYDRIVISEDLEPFANNNIETIDRFLIDKLEKISDFLEDKKIPVVFICSDRREKSDAMLYKLMDFGIYNALIDEDRNINKICELLNKPKNKSEASTYYGLTSGQNDSMTESDGVSEEELKSIITHFKKITRDEEKQIASFNNISEQYNDIQLKIIIRYLPIEVRANLEMKCDEYKKLVSDLPPDSQTKKNKIEKKEVQINKEYSEKKVKKEEISTNILEKKFVAPNLTKPIIIPSEVNSNGVKKVLVEKPKEVVPEVIIEDVEKNDIEADIVESIDENANQVVETTKKKGRGRPKKIVVVEEKVDIPKKGRGRPRKQSVQENGVSNQEVNLFNIDSNEEEKDNSKVDLFNIDSNEEEKDNSEVDLFNIDSNEEEKDNSEVDLFNIDSNEEEKELSNINPFDVKSDLKQKNNNGSTNYDIENTVRETKQDNTNLLLTKDTKIVTFVGTTKNGTSFIVNNLAQLFSSMDINTAILDMTQNRNSYYIYTNNDENLRKIAIESIDNLLIGTTKGIQVNKNLSVYTGLPGENKDFSQVNTILNTLIKNYSLVLIDCDFDTDSGYFESSQETYLVQSMDVLTIQPLTMFLRNLKNKNALDDSKLKIIINKEQKVRGLNPSVLIGGMAYYNEPSMSFMTELFNKNNIKYCSIPFEVQNNIKYLEELVMCSFDLKGYTKAFINSLKQLGNMVYPLLNKTTYNTYNNKKDKTKFSSNINDTLNKMKSNY